MPDSHAGQPLAVFDLDGTVTRFDTLGPFLALCLWHLPWRAPRLLWAIPALLQFTFERDRGALKGALLRAVLGGMTRTQLQLIAEQLVRWLLRRGVYRQALAAIQSHREHGDRLVLMSASTELYVPQLAFALGFDEVICTPLRWRADGRLDGRLAGANCRGEEKRRQLTALIERWRSARVYAYGNSGADLPHLQLAHQGYLVNGAAQLRSLPSTVERLRWRR